jgi:uncharacterized RDD family membrane protein YckC
VADSWSRGSGSQAPVVTGDAVVVDLRPAGFATRMTAIAIDAIVQAVLLLGVALVTALLMAGGIDTAMTTAVTLAFQALILIGYPTAFETATRGRSLGKIALGLRVVGTDGSPERFRQALARGLCGFVELWMTFGVVALFSSILNHDGRRIGDFLAGTIVVQERSGPRRTTTVPMPPRMVEWAASAELSQVDPESAAMAQQFVQRYTELDERARHEMGVRIATDVARTVSPPPPSDTSPVEFLAAVLAERRRRTEAKMAQQARPQY